MIPAAPVPLSVIIPVRNGSACIDRCLQALAASRSQAREVIVVDDGSTDDTAARVARHPCQLIRLPGHQGAAAARNAGAAAARSAILFFIDADCLVLPETLTQAAAAAQAHGPGTVVGGTYTLLPADDRFWSAFQSIFIHHAETKRLAAPDYVASHAMVIHRQDLADHGGFPEPGLPILEDVALSHGLRRAGLRLVMEPRLLVRHVFDYTLARSLANAVRKSRYWTAYSLVNRDLFADSGTASLELKANVVAVLTALAALAAAGLSGSAAWLGAGAVALGLDLAVSRRLLAAFFRARGPGFGLSASLYYLTLYPLAVAAGACLGLAQARALARGR
ncbi:MAG: glycosyltransferase [Thermodesulfobacteriota bacterium]